MISLGVLPLSPSTSSAARPLVSCESESAVKYTSPSSILGTTHTWLTHPGTLLSSTRSASSKPFSFAAKNSSCLYRCIASGTIWNAETIFLRFAGRFSVSAAATAGDRTLVRTGARSPAVRVVCLGRNSDTFVARLEARVPALRGRLVASGAVALAEVAARLRACDLVVQPYPDGVTSRRTSVMAALVNGCPTVTTVGALTEELWADEGGVARAA